MSEQHEESTVGLAEFIVERLMEEAQIAMGVDATGKSELQEHVIRKAYYLASTALMDENCRREVLTKLGTLLLAHFVREAREMLGIDSTDESRLEEVVEAAYNMARTAVMPSEERRLAILEKLAALLAALRAQNARTEQAELATGESTDDNPKLLKFPGGEGDLESPTEEQ